MFGGDLIWPVEFYHSAHKPFPIHQAKMAALSGFAVVTFPEIPVVRPYFTLKMSKNERIHHGWTVVSNLRNCFTRRTSGVISIVPPSMSGSSNVVLIAHFGSPNLYFLFKYHIGSSHNAQLERRLRKEHLVCSNNQREGPYPFASKFCLETTYDANLGLLLRIQAKALSNRSIPDILAKMSAMPGDSIKLISCHCKTTTRIVLW
jgi:hypothetical protein